MQRLIPLNGVNLGAFFLRQFHPGITGLPSTIVAPRQMVHMPSHRGMQWCDSPLFHPETDRDVRGRSTGGNQCQNSGRQAVLIFTFMDIYQDLSASNPRICKSYLTSDGHWREEDVNLINKRRLWITQIYLNKLLLI